MPSAQTSPQEPTSVSPSDQLARLHPEVLKYASPPFVLMEDLRHLNVVIAARAPEAIVLYCSRILEALASEALRRLGQAPSPNLFSNLQTLEHFNRIGTATRYWAHSLRRLGNSVRHVFGRIGDCDAVLAVHFAERWLDWFFCHYSHGHRLASLTTPGEPLGLHPDGVLDCLTRHLEQFEYVGPDVPFDASIGEVTRDPQFLFTPVLSAVLAEILIAREKFEDALAVLKAALDRFPDDLRLRQLKALCFSRTKRLDEALEWITPLYEQFPDDDETVGINAGIYKRRWQADRAKVQDLELSHRCYRDGWSKSGKKNSYLGINSATTALLLGQQNASRRLAREVQELLSRRAAALPADLREARQEFHFWDQVTLAEAHLLLGSVSVAERIYEDAYAAHCKRTSDIEVCTKQHDEILRALSSVA